MTLSQAPFVPLKLAWPDFGARQNLSERGSDCAPCAETASETRKGLAAFSARVADFRESVRRQWPSCSACRVPAQTRPSPRLTEASPKKPCRVAGDSYPHLTDEDVRLRCVSHLSPSHVVQSRQGVGMQRGVKPGPQGRAGQVPPEQRAEGRCCCGKCLVPGSRGWLGFFQVDEVGGTGPAREAKYIMGGYGVVRRAELQKLWAVFIHYVFFLFYIL